MNRIAKESPEFRKLMFEEAGARKGIDAALIEKDFWVCWTLKRIFEIDVLKCSVRIGLHIISQTVCTSLDKKSALAFFACVNCF